MAVYTRVIENLVLTDTLTLSGHEWDNTLIRNVTIQNVTGDGIMLRDVANVRIENVTINNVSGDGIKLSTLGSTSNVVIIGNTITNIGADGINAGQRKADGVDHTGLQILDNTIDTTGLRSSGTGLVHGLYIQSSDFLIQGNRILNSTDGDAISVRSSGVVRGNFIENAYNSGIAYFADNFKGLSAQLIIEENTIINSGTGTLMSDINLMNIPAGQQSAAVKNFIIRNNALTDGDGQEIDLAAVYAQLGFSVSMVNNQVVTPEIARTAVNRIFGEALNGTLNSDTLDGGRGNDTLNGGAGNDILTGNVGYDWLSGGTGRDTLTGGNENDRLDGGTGIDTAKYVGTIAAVVNLSVTGMQETGHGKDILSNIENVMSGAGNDILTGNVGANSLSSGAGNDTLSGEDGNDALSGGGGDDILSGGADDDRLVGGDGNDNLNGGAALDQLFGGNGDDTLAGISGSDTLYGGAGEDYIDGGSSADTLFGGTGNDTLLGDSSNDWMAGDIGNDRLGGDIGKDSIDGGDGRDTLIGGADNDVLTGGAGVDAFVFDTAASGGNIDLISDFSTADDVIQLENQVFSGLSAGVLAAAAFQANATGTATDASDRIIYETDTGLLYFDADGTGSSARVSFAELSPNLALSNADFLVI